MPNLFIICGHGAGDSGAVGNGYQEADRVRALAARIKALGGNNVIVGNTNRNWYRSYLVNNGNIPKGSLVLELHMDSSASPSAKGAHIIIHGNLKADKYDNALADYISSVFPGRAYKISKRSDLANINRAKTSGINYRLLECGFISNAEDVHTFNTRMDEIAKGILECFDIGVSNNAQNTAENAPTRPVTESHMKSVSEIAKEVLEGKWGNGTDRINKLTAAGYNASAVQNEVNRMLGGKTTKKSVEQVAKEVIAGKWGVGNARKQALTAAGYNYNEVQKKVNQLLK